MSLQNILERSTVNIFNVFQKYVAEQTIPKIIETFQENGVEIEENTLLQFFTDIENYNEIKKYFNKNTQQLNLNKNSFEERKEKIKIKAQQENDICDYVNTRGEDKGNKCINQATFNKEGHPRCNKHKNHVIKDYNQASENSKSNNKKSENVSSKGDNNGVDIKTLLAKIKANKERQTKKQSDD